MKKLNKEFLTAVKLLEASRAAGKKMTAKELATIVSSPLPFTNLIMRKLRVAGLIEVNRGPTGGMVVKSYPVNALQVLSALNQDPQCRMTLSQTEFNIVNSLRKAYSEVNI